MSEPSPEVSEAIIEIDPRVDRRWGVLQDHGGSLFTSAAWITAVTETYGLHPVARLLVDLDGDPLAGVAYCDVEDLRGRRIVSFPFSDYHEPLGKSLEDVQRVLETFVDGPPARFKIPEQRLAQGGTRLGYSESRDLLGHRIHVDGSSEPESRFAALHPKVRQNIRRSRRAGVRLERSSGLDALREFYDLHVEVRTRKYRLLPQPFSFFEAIHAAFAPTDAITVMLARLEGRAIAGIVYLEVGDTLFYKFNASNADGLNVRPNEELVLSGIELCAERKLSGIDLGVSDREQTGLVRYKQKLAQSEHDIVTLSTAARDDDARAAEIGSLLPDLTALFTDQAVPAEIAERAGARLYRYFI